MIFRDRIEIVPVTHVAFSGVIVASHVYAPVSLILSGLILRLVLYGGLVIGALVSVTRFLSSVKLVPFLIHDPCTMTGVFTDSSRVIMQVKVTSRPPKKPSFGREPVMAIKSGRGGTTRK